MFLSEMTHLEISTYIQTNAQLIIPMGTCEQHGYHLPVNTDILCVEYLARELAAHSGALIAPTVNYGVNLPVDKFLHGTAGITQDLLRGTLDSLLGWWRCQGFTRFILITYHGDPFHVEAGKNLDKDTLFIEPYEVNYEDILEKQDGIRHACEAETSVMLHLHPEKVRMPLAGGNRKEVPDFQEYLYHRKEILPEEYLVGLTGALGHPEAATPEKGRVIVGRMVAKMLGEYDAWIAG